MLARMVRAVHVRTQALHQQAIAAGLVHEGQPQGHQQQPAQGHTASWQHQAFPERALMPGGAPAHQRQPGQCASQCQPHVQG